MSGLSSAASQADREFEAIGQIVGTNVKRMREKHGVTIEEIGRVARGLGLRWNKTRVMELQRGDLHLTARALLLLPHIMSTVTKQKVSLADLLVSRHYVRLSPLLSVSPAALLDVVHGRCGQFASFEMDRQSVEPGSFAWTVASAGLADERAAKRAGMTLEEWLHFAHEMWKTSLHAERGRRARGTNPAHLGHVTRQLEKELQDRFPHELA